MLNTHVLVLNRSWVAVNVTSARRALTLLFQGQARVVHPENYRLYDFADWCALSNAKDSFRNGHFVRTPSFHVRLPEVILLNVFNDFIKREVHLSRRNVFERDQHKCQYCGRRLPKTELTLDHVLPRSRGGRDTWDNLVLACLKCNLKKSNRTPEEAGMRLTRAPRVPRWLPSFGAQIPKGDLISWQRFVDLAYWNTEMEE